MNSTTAAAKRYVQIRLAQDGCARPWQEHVEVAQIMAAWFEAFGLGKPEPPCHDKPREQWCDHAGPGGFMGHTCWSHGIQGPTVARGVPRTHWFDAGYLNNGHCSFMRTVDGASCCGSHGHAGEHWYKP